jgi:hypothetical protein
VRTRHLKTFLALFHVDDGTVASGKQKKAAAAGTRPTWATTIGDLQKWAHGEDAPHHLNTPSQDREALFNSMVFLLKCEKRAKKKYVKNHKK